jgi:ribosomal protein S18
MSGLDEGSLDWNISTIEMSGENEDEFTTQQDSFLNNHGIHNHSNKFNHHTHHHQKKISQLLKKIEGASKIQTYLLTVALPNATDESKKELIFYDLKRLSEYINAHCKECQKRIGGNDANEQRKESKDVSEQITVPTTPERSAPIMQQEVLTPASFDRLLSKLMSPTDETAVPKVKKQGYSESVMAPSGNMNPPSLPPTISKESLGTSSSMTTKVFFSLNTKTQFTLPDDRELSPPPPSPPPSPPPQSPRDQMKSILSPEIVFHENLTIKEPPVGVQKPLISIPSELPPPSPPDSPAGSPFSQLNISQEELSSLLPSPQKVKVPSSIKREEKSSMTAVSSPRSDVDPTKRRTSLPSRSLASHRLPQKDSTSPNSRTFPLARPTHLSDCETRNQLPSNKMNLRQVFSSLSSQNHPYSLVLVLEPRKSVNKGE